MISTSGQAAGGTPLLFDYYKIESDILSGYFLPDFYSKPIIRRYVILSNLTRRKWGIPGQEFSEHG
ncbi:hypothetical protein D3C73_1275010 [compost metagenome]